MYICFDFQQHVPAVTFTQAGIVINKFHVTIWPSIGWDNWIQKRGHELSTGCRNAIWEAAVEKGAIPDRRFLAALSLDFYVCVID